MSVSIALGSAAQIALFVAPALVLLSYVVGTSPMSLQFWPGAVTMVMIATVTASFITSSGRSAWFIGALLGTGASFPRQILGYAGVLGEWELTAVTEKTLGWAREYSRPVSMKHVGICTRDGPEEKTGEIRVQISSLTSQLDATLLVEGIECVYSARLSNPYSGMMACRDREAVPLKLWLK